MEAVFRQQTIQVIARHPAGNIRIALLDEIGICVPESS
jgi:hypothetical protein